MRTGWLASVSHSATRREEQERCLRQLNHRLFNRRLYLWASSRGRNTASRLWDWDEALLKDWSLKILGKDTLYDQ